MSLLVSSTTACTSTVTNTNTLIPSSPSILSISLSGHFHNHLKQRQRAIWAVKTGSQESYSPDLLRKPIIAPPVPSTVENHPEEEDDDDDDEDRDRDRDRDKGLRLRRERSGEEGRWVDWEDQILEDTVPLVGFVRTILHSGKYQSGDRLSPEHESTILERLLPFHPECEKKIGCGVDYITIGYHSQFEDSRCLFIVRKDGELVDFSYWKCIKGFIRKNYPLYADGFILKHFRRRRRYE